MILEENRIRKNGRNLVKILLLFIIGLTIVLIGATANFLAVKENNCRMPVYNEYIDNDNHFGFIDREEINYFFLADIFGFKDLLKFSIGDILLMVGIALMLWTVVSIGVGRDLWKKEEFVGYAIRV